MRKLALVFAGLMVVSAPLVVSAPSDVYAAAKKAKKAPAPAGKGDPSISRGRANLGGTGGLAGLGRAFSDLGASLSQPYVYDPGAQRGGKAAKGGKAGRADRAPPPPARSRG